ncbi:uncharacterized protein N7506_003351 [Penicillium brevicompactum]|uniref:uncharacterized protein n=1 Tax=Penicillium brevicompactum TaxID=5074 RepID=UPI002541A986|nr:uncharacterized protein N7506_003351 [Penicillium brevicompactum]KAJ5343527.1 hypothetical protein N7506_003351 [Penicillium brevicompactum]
MLDLAGYDSSDDEVEQQAPSPRLQTQEKEVTAPTPQPDQSKGDQSTVQPSTEVPNESTNIAAAATPAGPAGPVLGPASIDMAPLPEDSDIPYSTPGTKSRDSTFTPGSPNPAVNAKFEHFLSLKKQGVHFNSKLASSTSLKNPSLLANMMSHAGITEQSQYDTSLPADVWSTSTLPPWGFKGELLRAQHELRRNMEAQKTSGQRTSVDFVSGST